MFAHAEELGVDPKKIAVMGDSAGGGICAAVTHWNLESGKNLPIVKQILIYPMLDDRNVTGDDYLTHFATWSHDDNYTGWSSILGDKFGSSDLKPSAVPARLKTAEGLPPIYIETGELDIFRDEDLIYAGKFGQAGISAEVHIHPGCPHAFDVFAPGSDVQTRSFADRIRTLKALNADGNGPKL